jgi:5-methylthioadenosine/S-adenosylhomocysteine deaminase
MSRARGIRTLVPNLIYAGTGHEVQSVMVAGRFLMRDRCILVADEEAVRLEAQRQGEEVARRVAADPVHRSMALLDPMQRGWL